MVQRDRFGASRRRDSCSVRTPFNNEMELCPELLKSHNLKGMSYKRFKL